MKLNLKPYYQSSAGNQILAWLSAGNQTLDYGYSSVPETRHWIWDWFSAGNQTLDYGLVQCRKPDAETLLPIQCKIRAQ